MRILQHLSTRTFKLTAGAGGESGRRSRATCAAPPDVYGIVCIVSEASLLASLLACWQLSYSCSSWPCLGEVQRIAGLVKGKGEEKREGNC